MPLENDSENLGLPEPAITAREVPPSPGSSPLITPLTTETNNSQPAERVTSRGSVSWAQVPWPRREQVDDTAKPTVPDSHVYWRSPVTMVGSFIVGISMALGHHLYYNTYAGDLVGDPNEQQNKLRVGNFFAFATQFALAGSVGLAYTQWLWKTLRRRTISVSCLDSAFSADSALLSMFNPEMWWKIKLGSLLALLVWCLQIPSLFTPATLNVIPGLNETDIFMAVSCLNISTNGSDQHVRFAYSVPILNNTVLNGNDTSKLFIGPRTIVTRLSAATATTGNILPIDPPFLNSSYSLQFYGPSVQCDVANAFEALIIENLRNLSMSIPLDNFTEIAMSYFGFVPNEFIMNGGNVTDSAVAEEVSDVRMQRPVNASNQLWVAYEKYAWNSTGGPNVETHYMVCKLYNASYDVNFAFDSGAQNITKRGVSILHEIQYPKDDVNTTTNYAAHSYSAFMWALTDQLVGSMGWWVNNSTNQKFSEIAAPMEHNSLLGSVDLDPFFDYNNALYIQINNDTAGKHLSDQRLEDKALAKNRTLAVLIDELAFNTTISFMSSHLLSPITTNTTVHKTISVNRYSYNSKSLFLAYGFAIFATFIANLLGAWAYRTNEAAHDRVFSSILGATREAELGVLFCHRTQGKLPVPEQTKVTFLKYREMEDGGWSFRRTEIDTEEKRRRRSLISRRRRSSSAPSPRVKM